MDAHVFMCANFIATQLISDCRAVTLRMRILERKGLSLPSLSNKKFLENSNDAKNNFVKSDFL